MNKPYVLYYDPIISTNPKYMVQLSQEYSPDLLVSRRGVTMTTIVRGLRDEVVFQRTVDGLPANMYSDLTIHTTNPGPYKVYALLQWYYPGEGVFSKLFRMSVKVSKQGNALRAVVEPKSPVYAAFLGNLRRRLSEARKGPLQGTSHVPRPAHEQLLGTYPIEARYSAYGSSYSATGSNYNLYERSWTGQRTPGYWSKVGRKGLPVNPHTVFILRQPIATLLRHTQWEADINFGNTRQVKTEVNIVQTYYAVPPKPTSFKTSSAPARALGRLRSKMGADTANLAQDIGEIGETIRMVHKTIQRVHNANHALRVGNFPGAINALWSGKPHGGKRPVGNLSRRVGKSAKAQAKVLAENWLELQYGWKPLLSDVHDALEKVSRFAQQEGDLIVAAESGSASTQDSVVTDIPTTFVAPLPGHVAGKQTSATYRRCKYGVRFKVADAHKAFLAQTGFTNPINLTWELLPYSFVVDWFLPIGPWLESFTAFGGLQFVDGYITNFQRVDDFMSINDYAVTYQGPLPGGASHPVIWRESGLWWRTAVLLRRERLETFPLPELPVIKSPWSTGHVLNALALLGAGFEVGRRYHV